MSSKVVSDRVVQVAKTGELKDGSMKEFTVEGREIFLARVGDRIFAADNICPHMGGKLGRGKLNGTIVTCPRHHSQFDLVDGRVVRWTDWNPVILPFAKILRSPRPIVTFPVTVEGDNILVRI